MIVMRTGTTIADLLDATMFSNALVAPARVRIRTSVTTGIEAAPM